MRPFSMIVALLGAALALGACEKAKKIAGIGKAPPDEFAVYSRAPLSLPPDYALRPPTPGAVRPQGLDPRGRAKTALLESGLGKGAARGDLPVNKSPGLQALLNRTGASASDPGIRIMVNRETSYLAEQDETFTDRLMFWDEASEFGTVVDPAKEAKRIQENQALGRPITEGRVPTIRRKKKALLEGIFD